MTPLSLALICLLCVAAGIAIGWIYSLWLTRPKDSIDQQCASLKQKADHSVKTRERVTRRVKAGPIV